MQHYATCTYYTIPYTLSLHVSVWTSIVAAANKSVWFMCM